MNLRDICAKYDASAEQVLAAYEGACEDRELESRDKFRALGHHEVLAEIDRRARASLRRDIGDEPPRWPYSYGVESRMIALTEARLRDRYL